MNTKRRPNTVTNMKRNTREIRLFALGNKLVAPAGRGVGKGGAGARD